ncbi:MAG: ferritin-like protein [Marinobacterium sp.]|nr:ferritin-like protein [Marinobacterium sp.]
MTELSLPTPGLDDLLASNSRPVQTLEELHHTVQGAITLEFSAIAPCMTALWSICQPDSKAARFIHGRVFHKLARVYQMANLLLAVGGVPKFSSVHAPVYPSRIPASQGDEAVCLTLGAADQHFYSTLLPLLATCSSAETPDDGAVIETVGQFYKLIEDGLVVLEEQAQLQGETIFNTTPGYRQASGMGYGVEDYPLTMVTNLRQAHQVLRQLVGEIDPDEQLIPAELVALGRQGAELPRTIPLVSSDSVMQWPESAQQLARLFDGCYSELVRVLERSFETDERMHQRYLAIARPLMRDVLPALAQLLMQQPVFPDEHRCALPLWRYSLTSLEKSCQQTRQLLQSEYDCELSQSLIEQLEVLC